MDSDIYKAPQSNLVEEQQKELVLATKLSRLAAAVLDNIILALILIPLVYFFGGWELLQQGEETSLQFDLMITGAVLLAFVLINGNLLATNGQTVGKKVLGIKIVDLNGHLPSVKSHLLPRYAFYLLVDFIPIIGGLLSLVNVLYIFGQERRCMHDLLAGTRVVKCEQ